MVSEGDREVDFDTLRTLQQVFHDRIVSDVCVVGHDRFDLRGEQRDL